MRKRNINTLIVQNVKDVSIFKNGSNLLLIREKAVVHKVSARKIRKFHGIGEPLNCSTLTRPSYRGDKREHRKEVTNSICVEIMYLIKERVKSYKNRFVNDNYDK